MHFIPVLVEAPIEGDSPARLSCHSYGRTRPATCTGVGDHARVCQGTAGKKEGGGPVRGTQESDRIASPPSAEIEVRAGAVLVGRSCAESQTVSSLSQPRPVH